MGDHSRNIELVLCDLLRANSLKILWKYLALACATKVPIKALMTRRLIVPLVAILSTGCSQVVETRISSIGQPVLSAASFSLSQNMTRTPELLSAQKLVADSLVARGYTLADNGALHLEVTLAERTAALALGTATGPSSLAQAKRNKPLQNCEDREYRIGIAFTRVADGSLVYKGSAAEYHCNLPLADAIPELVKAALADLGNPRGSYAANRTGRD